MPSKYFGYKGLREKNHEIVYMEEQTDVRFPPESVSYAHTLSVSREGDIIFLEN